MSRLASSIWPIIAALAATPAAAQDGQTADKATDGQRSADDRDVIVTARQTDGYRAIDSDALGIDLTIQQTPATVNVITDQFLKDTGAHRLSDIITYTPGIVNNEKATSVSEYFIVRGFATSLTYLNGVRQACCDIRRGLATIDRVEIVKGPAGAEAGIADPGGTVNIITKKPQTAFAASVDAALGDYHYGTITGDVTGPVALDGKLQARLIGGYEQSVVWRPGLRRQQPFVTVAPSLKLDYASGGSLYAQYEYNYAKEYFDRGVLHVEGYYPGGFGPRDSSSVSSRYNYSASTSHRAEIGADQKLGPLTAAVRYARVWYGNDLEELAADAQSGDLYQPFDPDASIEQQARDSYTWNGVGYTIPFFYSTARDFGGSSENVSASLTADFHVFGIRNTVVGGYEHAENDYDGASPNPQVSNVLDIRAPDTDQRPVVVGAAGVFDQAGTETIDSYYLKWVARPGDRLRLVLAGRWDHYRQGFSYTYDDGMGYSEAGSSSLGDQLFSYRAAASFDVTKALTAFFGYSDAYIPQSGFTRAGPVPALRARSLEAGVKLSLAGGKALWTNTVYSIRQDNLTIEDPTNVLPEAFVILFGAVRVRGFESELTGKVLPGLDLTAGVSVLQSRTVQNDQGYLGKRFLNVPNLQASAFASYNLEALGVKPLTVRLGVSGLGNREGNPENTFKLPGYVRVDTGAAYRIGDRLELGVAIENLFDTTYYVAADQGGLGNNTISVGNRRLVQATLGYKF